MERFMRLHAPDPRERGPHPKCMHPNEDIRCSFCDTSFKCGNAPHDDEGVLCPSCGKGESVQSTSSRGVTILKL